VSTIKLWAVEKQNNVKQNPFHPSILSLGVFVYILKRKLAYLLLLWCTQIAHCMWNLSEAYMIDALKTSYFYESLYIVECISRIWHTYHAYIV
jgi:hypothetical protein